jgi:hypothetical protein
MTKAEAMKRWQAGEIIVCGTYHGGTAKTQSLRGQNGQRRDAAVVRQVVLTDSDSIGVTEWLPDGTPADAWKAPLTKGAPCVIIVEGMEVANGTRIVNRGKIEALKD